MSNRINNKIHIALFVSPFWLPIAFLVIFRVVWALAGAEWDGGNMAFLSTAIGLLGGFCIIGPTGMVYGAPDFSFLDKRKGTQ